MKKILPVVLGATIVTSVISGEANAALKKPEPAKKVSNTAGFVDVDAIRNSTVYIYKGGKAVGKEKTDTYGHANVAIHPQKKVLFYVYFIRQQKG